jgi:hypothetical protein
MAPKKKIHYVDNKEFFAALVAYREECATAEKAGLDVPRINNYIGTCLLKIATHLSYKANFINYSFREDMILDGVENCILYLRNFDPEKSSNPFSYFTQITFYAFLRRIMKEKKQMYVRNKMIQAMAMDQFDVQEHDSDNLYSNQYLDFLQSNQDFDDYVERRKAEKALKKVRVPRNPLEELLEFDENDEGTDE